MRCNTSVRSFRAAVPSPTLNRCGHGYNWKARPRTIRSCPSTGADCQAKPVLVSSAKSERQKQKKARTGVMTSRVEAGLSGPKSHPHARSCRCQVFQARCAGSSSMIAFHDRLVSCDEDCRPRPTAGVLPQANGWTTPFLKSFSHGAVSCNCGLLARSCRAFQNIHRKNRTS